MSGLVSAHILVKIFSDSVLAGSYLTRKLILDAHSKALVVDLRYNIYISHQKKVFINLCHRS